MSVLQPTLALIVPAGAGVLLAGAALHDVALRTISNAASIGLGLVGLALRLQDGWIVIGTSLLAATAVFAVAVLCWRRGWLGGGNVKLLAATTLIVPSLQIGSLFVFVAQCGGVLALIYLALSRVVRVAPAGQPSGVLRRLVRVECWRICSGAPLPYAFAITAGGITLLIKGP